MYANLIHVKVRHPWVGVSVGGCAWMYTPSMDVWVFEGMHMCAHVYRCEYTHICIRTWCICTVSVYMHAYGGVSACVLVYM